MATLGGLIIGIIVLAVIVFIICVIYLGKCYSDYLLSRHKENIRPPSFSNNDLSIGIDGVSDPIPHDVYSDRTEVLKGGNHNDMDMVTESIEQFIRKENYRKSLRSNQNKKYQRVATVSSSSAGANSLNGIKTCEISLSEEDNHQRTSNYVNVNVDTDKAATMEAPVIVHQERAHKMPSAAVDDSHIYAPVKKESDNIPPENPSEFDKPTYFRPFKRDAGQGHPALQMELRNDQNKGLSQAPATPPQVYNRTVIPATPQSGYNLVQEAAPKSGYNPVQETAPKSGYNPVQVAAPKSGYNHKPFSYMPPAGVPLKTSRQDTNENVPPNKQDTEFDGAFSPPSSRRNGHEVDGSSESSRSTRKSKKSNSSSKGNKKKKKAACPDLDIAKPYLLPSDDDAMSETYRAVVPRDTIKSPPLPPKPRLNPLVFSPDVPRKPKVNPLLLSPTLNVRSSQL